MVCLEMSTTGLESVSANNDVCLAVLAVSKPRLIKCNIVLKQLKLQSHDK
jgi:hypothetical protein